MGRRRGLQSEGKGGKRKGKGGERKGKGGEGFLLTGQIMDHINHTKPKSMTMM